MLLNHQKFMRLTGLVFLLGVVLASYLPSMPPVSWYVAAVLSIPVMALLPRFAWLRLLAVLMAGAVWLMTYLFLFSPMNIPTALDGRTVTVSGEVVSLPQANSQRVRFDFRVDEIIDADIDWSGKIRLGWYASNQPIKAGQQWRLKVKLKPVHGFANPGGYDYEAGLLSKGISATGYVREADTATQLSQHTTLHSLRQVLSEWIVQALPHSDHRGLLVALTTGDRQYMSSSQWQVLTRTGTVHLMAISGLHIGLVYGLFFWLGKVLWRTRPRLCLMRPAQDVAIVSGLLAAFVYAAMAGFSIPTQRALIMLAVIAIALLSRRLTSPMDVLQAALIVVLLVDPLAVISAGFWLSFFAVALILLALDRSRGMGNRPRWYELIRIQWVLAFGLLPLTSLFFSQVSIVAPVMNLLAVPWVSLLVVPICLAGAMLFPILPAMSRLMFELADNLTQLLWSLLLPASESPYAVLHPASPALWVIVLAVAGLMLLLFHRVTLYRLAGVLLLSPMLLPASSPVDRGEFQADFLDVGQGLAVVIRTARHTLLYDAGFSNDSGFDVGRQVILPYLWHEGVSRLDRVVLSHDDRDHVGGYDSVARELTVGELNVMPGSRFLSRSSAARVCRAGEQWQWDGVDFSFLHPPGTGPTSENNRSCVLKITSRGGSVLLTGDIEKSVEDKLIKQYPDGLKTDVLLAPHHGSATSSSAGFIAATQPSEVVYAAGYRNRFGFPRPDVQQRYAMAGSQQWNTADTGMIRYRFTKRPGHFQRQHYRDTSRRIWQPATEHSPAK